MDDPIRDRPQSASKDTRWMFYAKWWFQYRKETASRLARYALTEPVRESRSNRKFYRFYTMKNYHACNRYTFFLRTKQRWRPRFYAGRFRLAPARWI